jgi:hypothetical protein
MSAFGKSRRYKIVAATPAFDPNSDLARMRRKRFGGTFVDKLCPTRGGNHVIQLL